MPMGGGRSIAAGVLALTLGLAGAGARAESPNLGREATPDEIAAWDISIDPSGAGLPAGSGSARQGAATFAAKCAACHGENAAGRPNDALVGGQGTLATAKPLKTAGSDRPDASPLVH